MRRNSPEQAEVAALVKTSNSDSISMTHDEIVAFVSNAVDYKPKNLIIDDVKWKYAVRTALRGKNLMFVGPSGCGKTLACQSVGKTFPDRPWFEFNLGASQDPRGMLIGNTHFDSNRGTFVAEALFARAIQTKGAIILLDEMSRAHDDAANILMTVLDSGQRYLRIDEKPDTPTIKVAEGVVFLSTANIGNEYTGARVMDRALLDRFFLVEMVPLNETDELNLLKEHFPKVTEKTLEAISKIAAFTRDEMKTENPHVSTIISTRMSVEMAGMIYDGFTLAEAAEVGIYPFFTPAGGADSERSYIQKKVQQFLPSEFDDKDSPWKDGDGSSDKDGDDKDNRVPW